MKNWPLYFTVGMVVGGFVGYYICIRKNHIVKTEKVETKKPVVDSKIDKKDYAEKIFESSYKQEIKEGNEEWDEAEKVNPVEPETVPYVISPEEFSNEHSDYAKLTMVYYEDNEVLLNEEEECVDIGSTIGYDFINHFGDFEKDAVFIRNEALGNDYEILMEHTSYEGVGGE